MAMCKPRIKDGFSVGDRSRVAEQYKGKRNGLKMKRLAFSWTTYPLMQQNIGYGRHSAALIRLRTSIYPRSEDSGDARMNVETRYGIQILGNSVIHLEVDNERREELNRCLVGETLQPYNFVEMDENLKRHWRSIGAVKLKRMGSMKLLLVFDTTQNMEEALDSEDMKNYFLEVRKWSSGEANRTRKVCLEVIGLPIHGWSKENMAKIGEVWGRLLKVEEEEE
ncbi:hypothetical protein PIB30_014316 [Stylosanthes scabra]|uniref:DUF4283 domain-containing protein n=1 Tax=Stylosanthes scabra TaxID=79078 RepID=A0ABU6Q7D0_9FABA|nr:hypothetical protein [Stylosanthes scabra]